MHDIKISCDFDILEENRRLAKENRKILDDHGVYCIEILGSIGSGKTTLIETICRNLRDTRTKVIVGDVVSEYDKQRIAKLSIEAIGINTGKECHLDAHLIHHALEEVDLEDVDLLLIENVGNLICPADFDLGAHERFIVVSVTEGRDVIRKHPHIFMKVNAGIINKVDLAGYFGINADSLVEDILSLNRDCKVFKISLKTGEGVRGLLRHIAQSIEIASF